MDSMDGIDLQDSFVLGWEVSENQFSIQLEASIWPSSVHYAEPKANEYTCYKKAVLTFSDFSSISCVNGQSAIEPTTDIDGSIDYGNIDSFIKTESGFFISACFGNVSISNGKVVLNVCT
ncbi:MULTISPECIES: hypothetical protein [Pseudoalteromonas]|uniref:hypothetical protein n=1 Tax=Pseudoalteromonas TaxID=53246 RepID=UPI0005F91636|nr:MULTISPECIES: hypothetical protein [Pseudoalteromonas]MBB1347498.1 hypothetical protein [Pseudoalteromonas sp. SG45-2]MBB1450371.1 hypothetical protein [Pseudoalteromonas sp. SG43-1]